MKTSKAISIFFLLFLFIFCLPGISPAQNLKIKVILDKAKVYFEPDLTSHVVKQVPAGVEFEVQKITGEFYQINLPPDEQGFEVSGYIHKNAVEKIEPAEAPEKRHEETPPPAPEKETAPPAQKAVPPPPPPKRRPEFPAYEERKRGGVEIGFRFYGDFLFTMGANDYNAYSEDTEKRLKLTSYPPWYRLDTNSGLMKNGFGGGGEFTINVMPYLGFGLGAGYIQQSAESAYKVTDTLAPASEGIQIMPTVSAIPLTFNLYFNVPAGPWMNLSLYGGLDLYLGNVKWNVIASAESGIMWMKREMEWNAKTNPLGFHAGLSLELKLAKSFAFILGANGRIVTFTDLTADLHETYDTWATSPVENTYPQVTLWSMEEEISGQWYTYMRLDDTEPSGSWFRNVRKAEFSLGGVALIAGFKIRIK